jgi:hypothetical protein
MPSFPEQFGFARPYGLSDPLSPNSWFGWPWSFLGAPLRNGNSADISLSPGSGILGPYFAARNKSGDPPTGGILQNLPSSFPQQLHEITNDSGVLGPALAKINAPLLNQSDSDTDRVSDGTDPAVENASYPASDPVHADLKVSQFPTPTDAPSPSFAMPSDNDLPVGTNIPPIDASPQQNGIDSEGAFSPAHDGAQSLISSDPELSAAVALAERAGDKSFNARLASIVANLELNPDAARGALWREVFASGLRSSAVSSLANVAADWAVQQAAGRLDKLRPDLGMLWAYDSARSALHEHNRNQHQTLYQISTAPISPQRKWELMAENGLIDSALASSVLGDPHRFLLLFGGSALAGGLSPFGPGRQRLPKSTALGDFENQTRDLLDAAERIRQKKILEGDRYIPGIGSGTGSKIEGRWLFEIPEAFVPTQVADMLRGTKFSDFNEYRQAFWRSVLRVPELAEQFSPQNRALMAKGQPPRAPESEHSPLGNMYHLHHVKRIGDKGDVYNADNIRVVTPKRHYEIHYGPFP